MTGRRVALLAALLLVPGLTIAQQSNWPDVEAQLRRDHVPAGSPLESLIRENQDFAMLDPREMRDEIRVPPWLRVHWRKAHPEMKYDAVDPTGGYPFVLKEVHEWMREHPYLEPGAREPDVGPDGQITEAGIDTTVGTNTRISGSQTSARSESDIRIFPNDPSRVVSASNNISGSGRQAVFFSANGGVTWGQTTLPLASGDAFHSDPTVEWTTDGTAWSTTIGINSSGTILKMRSYKSTNGGSTWNLDGTFSGSQTTADKQMTWVDRSATSPFKDTIYATWHNGNPAYVNRRAGPGGSWGTPLKVSGSESTGTAIGGDIKTNAFGDVFVFWPTTGNRRVFMKKSTNGGVSFGSAVQISSLRDSFQIGIPAFNSRKALIYVTAGAYRTEAKNNVYAAWTDLSGDSGCTTGSQEPGSNVNSTCKSRIWFARSTNGGTSFSAPIRINHQASLNDQFNPALAVDESNGRIGIMYYDTVADPGRKKTDVWYQTSADDGQTWSPALKVTTAMTDETISGADFGNQYGDYNSLSGYASVFLPSWTDRRNNSREEIWTAPITEPGGCLPPSPPTGLIAQPAGPGTIGLGWNPVNGATEYHLYRSTTPGTGYLPVTTTAFAGFLDTGLDAGVTYYYVVRSFAGCESVDSNEAFATVEGGDCVVSPLYANDFETGSGLADWTKGSFLPGAGAGAWKGIQTTCPAQTGVGQFRYGGVGCAADYAINNYSFAQPQGATGIQVPVGATETRLTFGHRRNFQTGFDGATLRLSLDGVNYVFVPGQHIVNGTGYDGVIDPSCAPAGASGASVFTGVQSTFTDTEVDLDATCNLITGGTGGCAGRTLYIAFTGISDCATTGDGWFIDNVTVSACTLP